MLKYFLSLIVVLFFSGCQKEDSLLRKRLKEWHTSIDGNKIYKSVVSYFPDGKIAQVNNYINGNISSKLKLTYLRDGNIFEKKLSYSDDKFLTNRDSFVYDEKGRLKNVYQFSVIISPEMPLTWLDSFIYNEKNEVITINTSFIFEDKIESTHITSFQWDNGNIVREFQYSNKGLLQEDLTYIYDDKPNYLKGVPGFGYSPEFFSKNNVLTSVFDGHGVSFTSPCETCHYKITYDEDGLPIIWEDDYNTRIIIEYQNY